MCYKLKGIIQQYLKEQEKREDMVWDSEYWAIYACPSKKDSRQISKNLPFLPN